jgi:hypothetical protein
MAGKGSREDMLVFLFLIFAEPVNIETTKKEALIEKNRLNDIDSSTPLFPPFTDTSTNSSIPVVGFSRESRSISPQRSFKDKEVCIFFVSVDLSILI